MEWYLKTISEDLTLLTISPGSIVLTVQGPMLDLRKAETVLRHGKFLAGNFFKHSILTVIHSISWLQEQSERIDTFFFQFNFYFKKL